ncbi:targeting protein for Xklp2 isoform X1 [Scyliorhinus torazame]|uniref:targeting protein for Xklp2 isoform X1 n=1 Tax=Scyliorhinus torazame TaxID=75743 RepID=UPI003B5C2D4C
MADAHINWNYDAPTHLDFNNLEEQYDPEADCWFDQQNKQGAAISPSHVEAPATPTGASHCCEIGEAKSVSSQLNKDVAPTKDTADKPPQNFVLSVEASRDNSKTSPKTMPLRRSTRKSTEQLRKELGKIRAVRRTQDLESTEPPVNKKAKLVLTGRHSGSRTGSRNSKLTLPATPTVLKRKQHMGSKGKSTEELEMEKIAQFQKEVAEQRKANEESLKLAISGAGQNMKRTHIPPTKPMDIKFHTDERIKAHGETQVAKVYKEVNFTNELRKPQQFPTRGHKGTTVPKPFKLSHGNKRKHEATGTEGYVSLAQQVEAFHCRTPSRYQVEEDVCKVPEKMKLTRPHTPMLITKTRARPTTCKSAAEVEAEEVEKMQSYKFKAQEINPRLLEGGPILPKKPLVKEPTKPIGFDLEIEKRIRGREENRKPEEIEDHCFHSRPCPTRILEDVVGVPEKRLIPITMPKSPAFTMKNRVRIPHREENIMKEEKHVIKANPMPHSGVPFKPKCSEEKLVEIQPFSFDSRDKQRETLKEQKIQELRKELTEFPAFKAQLLPDFDSDRLPEKVVKSPTKVQPFHLRLEERGALRDQRWTQMMKEELKQQKEATCFKANPSSVIYREPFLPKKANRSSKGDCTVQEKFELATEKRAKVRAEFEMRKAEKESMREKLEDEKQKEIEEDEREEIARLRQDLVHKANPVRHYRKVEIKPSEQQLTVPQTPNFSDRIRL